MKFETHREYDPRLDAWAESALLTVWAGLGDYHDDLVLVGGLAPRYLCGDPTQVRSLPATRTIDVDLGIALGATAGQYGSLRDAMSGQGFRGKEHSGRFEKMVEGHPIYVDFLVENPGFKGTATVDDIQANVLPGIDRALASPRVVTVEGVDLHGARQRLAVRVCEVGPWLVLKLRAFASRQETKDAYDVLYTVLNYDRGTEAAATAFAAERGLGNRAFPDAWRCLEQHFHDENSPAPVKAAYFVMGEPAAGDSADARFRRLQLRQQVVSAAHLLKSAL